MQYPTCRHVKTDGVLCGSPALQHRKYCYHHLMQRGRRLRRAFAASRGESSTLHLPPLEDLRAIRVALSEIVQALAVGQLEHRSAGLMLYAIQQAATVSLRVSQIEDMQLAREDEEPASKVAERGQSNSTRLQEYPEFERNLGLPPGIDLDAETEAAELKAEEHARVLSIAPGSVPARGNYTREEAYQGLQWQIHFLKQQLADYADIRKEQQEKSRKELLSIYPPSRQSTNSA